MEQELRTLKAFLWVFPAKIVEVLVTRTAHAIVEQGEEAQESQDDYIKINELPMKEEVSCLQPLPGEEETGPKGVERGGYSPIPRRDARAGEWEHL